MSDKKKREGVAYHKGDTGFYVRAHRVLARFILWLFRVRVRYPEREPDTEGSYLVCANHVSALDPVLIAAAMSRRQPHFMAKKELFRIPLLGGLLRTLGAYPVDRAGDVGAIKTSLALLEQGNCVGVFPQGTRCPGKPPRMTADKVKNGAGLLCEKTQATVMPVCLKTKNDRPRLLRRVEVIFGEPISYATLMEDCDEACSPKERYAHISRRVFDRICTLYAEAER